MVDSNAALPRYNIKRIVAVRDTLLNDDLSDFIGFVPIGEHFEELVDRLCVAFPRVRRFVMWDSVRDLAGKLLTHDVLRDTLWRLSGNIRRLRDGHFVPPWHVQLEKEWMPAQVVAYQPEKSTRGKIGGRYTLRILAGTACPLMVRKFWPRRFARYIALGAGYTRRGGEYVMGDISELVNLRLWLRIDPELCRPGAPSFDEVGCTAGLLSWNRDLIKKRFRRGFVCPRGYDHHCYKCPVGYLECPAATHKETIDVEEEAGSDRDGPIGDDVDGPIAGSTAGREDVLA